MFVESLGMNFMSFKGLGILGVKILSPPTCVWEKDISLGDWTQFFPSDQNAKNKGKVKGGKGEKVKGRMADERLLISLWQQSMGPTEVSRKYLESQKDKKKKLAQLEE